MKNNESLLNISITDISLDDLHNISEILNENPSINTVDLSQHNLDRYNSNISVISIADLIKDISINPRANYSASFDSYLSVLTNALKDNHTITELHLQDNSLDAGGAKIIGAMLKENNKITHLKLERNRIHEEGAESIADGVKSNNTLTSLNLNANGLGPQGAVSIAGALQVNRSIVSLDLGSNAIGSIGVGALQLGLHNNKILREINLSFNNITNNGLKKIAEIVANNSQLNILNLSNNEIDDEGVPTVVEIIRSNSGLTTLTLTGNRFTQEGAREIYEALLRNWKISDFTPQNSSFLIDPDSDQQFNVKDIILRNKKIEQEKDPVKKFTMIKEIQPNHDDFPSLAEVTRFKMSTTFLGIKASQAINNSQMDNHNLAHRLKDLQLKDKLGSIKKEDSALTPT